MTNGAVNHAASNTNVDISHGELQTSLETDVTSNALADMCETTDSKPSDTCIVNVIEMEENTHIDTADANVGTTTEADDTSDEYTAMLNETSV